MTTTPQTTAAAAQGPANAEEFFRWHREGELRLQRCVRCRRYQHPAVVRCPNCGGTDLRWEPLSGRGEVFTWAVTHFPFQPAFLDDGPYVTAVVQLAEGPRLLALLRQIEPEAVVAGLPVSAFFEEIDGGGPLVVFRPASNEA